MSKIAEKAKFIGRNDEVNELAEVLEKTIGGEGQIIFVSGEAGIGKTRLIQEVRTLPIGQNFNWLTARCIYQEGTDPYLPFTDALRDWLEPTSTALRLPSDQITRKTVPEKFEINELINIPLLGPKLAEEPSMSFGSFMIKEPKAEFCLSTFSTLVKNGRMGLCITRVPPEKLDDLSKYEGVKIYWLSSKPSKNSLPPSLTKLSHEITEFLKDQPNSIIMLDGLEYLISHIEFNNVLRFVNELIDSMAMLKGILIMPINPLTIDPKQLALLERNMNTIDINTLRPPLSSPAGSEKSPMEEPILNEEQLQQGRNRMFETTTQKILAIGAIKPVALFIDDLHWADVGALQLLHYLARSSKNHPVAIIGVYRPEDLADPSKPHPLLELIDRLVPEKQLKLITLERFDQLETGEIIQSLLQNKMFPKELVEFVHVETEGNPFFIEEMLRSLVEEDIVRYVENIDSWVFDAKISKSELPDTIKDVVNARIGRLPKNTRLVLEIASVLGNEFDYINLSAISKFDEEELVSIIDDLIHFKLINELPTEFGQPIRYRFAHNKLCEVLYDELGQSHKRLLHSKAASAIEERHKNDLDNVIYELAQHCYHGGDYLKGLDYQIKAGEKALMSYAPEKARMFYQWSLDSIKLVKEESPDSESNNKIHVNILSKLSEICILIGEWDEALKYINYLLEHGKELAEINKIVDAHNYAGRIYIYRSAWDDAISHFNDAITLAKESSYQQGMLEGYNGLGDVYERRGEYIQAMEYMKNFMELAESMNSQNEIARGYKAFAMISTKFGDYNTALDYYKKCIDLFTKTKNYGELARTYTNIGIPYFELGEFDKVIEWNEKSIELATRVGDIRTKGLGYSNTAEVYARKQKFEKAIEYANRALEIFTKLDDKPMIGLVWMNYGLIYKNKQAWQPSRYYFEKSLALLKGLNVPYYLADCTRQFGLMLADQGTEETLEESHKYLNEALEIFKTLGAKKFIDVIHTELKQLAK